MRTQDWLSSVLEDEDTRTRIPSLDMGKKPDVTKPKLLLNHEAEAEAKAKALTFWKHEAEAEALTFEKHKAEAEG